MVNHNGIGHDIRREIFQTKRRTVFVLFHDFLVILADCDILCLSRGKIVIFTVVVLLNIECQIILNTADGKDGRTIRCGDGIRKSRFIAGIENPIGSPLCQSDNLEGINTADLVTGRYRITCASIMSVCLIRNIRRRIDNQRGCFVEVRFGGKGFHIMIDRYRLAFLIELLFACFIIQFIFAVKALKLENKILAFAGNRPYDDILGILSCRAMRHRQFEFCSIGIRNPVQIIDTLFGNRQILDFEGEEAVDGILYRNSHLIDSTHRL